VELGPAAELFVAELAIPGLALRNPAHGNVDVSVAISGSAPQYELR
jgi:hypothetical protein